MGKGVRKYHQAVNGLVKMSVLRVDKKGKNSTFHSNKCNKW